jgi:hypothetical protein
MRNADVAELFDLVEVDTRVVIAAERGVGPVRKAREKRCVGEVS